MIKKIVLGAGGIVILGILYLLLWPVPFSPAAWTPETLPALIGVYAPNSKLALIKKLNLDGGVGPEDTAVDSRGRIYTGLDDGRILRCLLNGDSLEVFCDTNGRPLGMAFDATGNLVVADLDKGLISVNPEGQIRVLAKEAGGIPIKLADDLDIATDGTIYFSDATTKYSSNELMLDLLEHRGNGRLLAYTPKTKTTRVLIDNLYFANGVALSPDESFVLVNETWKYRIKRYWLTGSKKGQSDIFIKNLPGFPDNITSNRQDTFWLALVQGPKTRNVLDSLLPKPFLRKIIYRLPEFLSPAPTVVGYVLGLDINGNVTHNLQDLTGEFYGEITSVSEHNGVLFFGSLSEKTIGYIAVP